MPQGTPLKDYYGRIYGYMHVQSNGDIWCYDFYGRMVGKYIRSLDVTRDFYGRNVSSGNTLAALLPPIEQQNK